MARFLRFDAGAGRHMVSEAVGEEKLVMKWFACVLRQDFVGLKPRQYVTCSWS